MMNVAEIRITEAVWPEDRAPIARLMREYVEALEADISFQDFESESSAVSGSCRSAAKFSLRISRWSSAGVLLMCRGADRGPRDRHQQRRADAPRLAGPDCGGQQYARPNRGAAQGLSWTTTSRTIVGRGYREHDTKPVRKNGRKP
jgi:hypothetical protein